MIRAFHSFLSSSFWFLVDFVAITLYCSGSGGTGGHRSIPKRFFQDRKRSRKDKENPMSNGEAIHGRSADEPATGRQFPECGLPHDARSSIGSSDDSPGNTEPLTTGLPGIQTGDPGRLLELSKKRPPSFLKKGQRMAKRPLDLRKGSSLLSLLNEN